MVAWVVSCSLGSLGSQTVQGFGDLGFRIWVLGFRVSGLGFIEGPVFLNMLKCVSSSK